MRVRTYDPFRQFDRAFSSVPAQSPRIPLDVLRSDDNVELHFDLPGVDVDSIDLTVEKRELTLKAERHFEVGEGQTVARSERRHGVLSRSLVLAENLDTDSLAADYADGVLVVTIPVIAEAKPRKIEISQGQAELNA
ncbi:MAG: Hsp20/alpha crystallin family protein [Acidimicrobiales bacterium]